jgi:urease accessory protein UreF
MIAETNLAPRTPGELLGDAHPLLEQLGSAEDLALAASMPGTIGLQRVIDLPSLRHFLDGYREQVLGPVELPSIVAAYHHATRGEARELIALDTGLRGQAAIKPFAVASCRVGQRQLSRLRPMRDQRLVKRYLAAIEAGEALGWHTLVYGVSLAMFSLPLRQGLQNYIEQTVHGFIQSSAKSLQLSEADVTALLLEQAARIPAGIEAALQSSQSAPHVALIGI